MKSAHLLTVVILLAAREGMAFGAPDLATAEIRSKTYEAPNTKKKGEAFDAVLIWAAETFADANQTIKLKDKEMGVILAKGNIDCSALKLGSGFAKDQRIEFTLKVACSDKVVKITVSDLVGKSEGAFDSGARPSNQKEADDAFNKCVEPFVAKIKSALN